MARRPKLAAAKNIVKNKKVRASKVAQILADSKHMGDEPLVTGKVLEGQDLLRVLNWYNYMCGRTEAREFIEDYLKANKRTEDLKKLKRVPDTWINLQAGWYARLLSRGATISHDKFESRLNDTLSRFESADDDSDVPVEKKSPTVVVTVHDRVAEKASDSIGELDELIDKVGWNIDVYDWLTKKQVTPIVAKKIRDFFKPIADEAMELNSARAVGGKNIDKQLLEGYAYLTKAQVKARAVFYAKLLEDCDRFADVAKKQRAPRKKKTVTPDKKLKNFKYQVESKDFRLASISPEKIFSADEIWTLNTKYKVLTVIRKAEGASLEVSGSSFKNYSEDTSKSYRLGRKFDDVIETVTKSGKRAIGKVVEKLKETTLQSRSNENTILVRAL